MDRTVRARQLQHFAELVKLLVLRDLRVRYRGSVLGYLWSMMNPLLYMTILSFVFSHLLKFKVEHFSIFILTGILTWNLFSQSLSIGTNSIISSGSLIRKIKVPIVLFPAASILSVCVNFVLALIPFFIVSAFLGRPPTWNALALPFIFFPLVFFTFGIALGLACINTYFRDVGHVLDPILTMAFYATPIVYPIEALPENIRAISYLNPMVHFVEQMRAALYGGALTVKGILTLWLIAFVALVIGVLIYRKMRNGLIYKL